MKSLFFTLYISASIAFADITNDITYLTEDFPPYNFKSEQGEAYGINVDIVLKMFEILKSTKTRKDIKIQPWVRAYRTTKDTKEKAALFSTSRSLKREALFKWVGPLVGGNRNILVLEGNPKNIIIKNKNDYLKYKYSVIRDDVGENLLRNLGVTDKNISYSTNFVSIVKKLQGKKVDAIPYSDITAASLLRKNNLSNAIKLIKIADLPNPNTKGNYIAFNKNIDDKVIKLHQDALNKVMSNEEFIIDIKNKYIN